MKKCESMTCGDRAIYIFNWSVPSDLCGCPACHYNYTKLFCLKHATTASENLAEMGHRFSKQAVCIMERV